ncbi:hypothetical protein JCM11251_006876 [Rhodosporidiobolus azoricus]
MASVFSSFSSRSDASFDIARPHNSSDDALLSSRLESLGYSLSLPEAATVEQPPPSKPLIERFMEQVEEDIKRMRQRRGLVLQDDVEEGDETSSHNDGEGVGSDSDSTTSPSSECLFTLPEADADLTLHDLMRLAKINKEEAIEAKKAGVRKEDGRIKTAGGAGEDPPLSSPSSAFTSLRLGSPVKAQISPSKRRRASSSPPRTPPPRTPSFSPALWPSLSPSPCKRTALRKKSLVGVLSVALTLAGAASTGSTPSGPPLVATVSRLCEEIPGLSLPALVDLAQSLRPNAHLLEAASERAASNGRTFGSSLNFLGKNLFSTSATPPRDKPLATLLLSRALNLYPTPCSSQPFLPAVPFPPAPRILSTRHTICVQCASPLTLRNRTSSDKAYLADTSSPAVPIVIVAQTCGWCGAVHAPDHVEFVQSGKRLWLWDDGAEAFKVGERVWVAAGLARHYSSLLLEQAVSPGGFAEFWNGLYASDAGRPDFDMSEEDGEEEKEDDGYSSPTPAVHVKPQRKNRKSGPFLLRPRHIWRTFVFFSCFSAIRAPHSPYSAFVSLARPPTEELVALANRDLFGSNREEAARVLAPHACEKCTRKRREWRGGPATEEEKRAGVRYAGSHEDEEKNFVEDTKICKSSSIQLAVCDGIQIGHPLCAYPNCTNPPEAHRRAKRFCDYHQLCRSWCGIVGCERPVSDELDDEADLTEACKINSHQMAWRTWKKRSGELKARGWAGRKKRVDEGIKYEVVEVGDDGEVSVDEDEARIGGNEADGEESKPSRQRLAHMWTLRRSSNLQILVGACGTPLAWAKFAQNEHPSEVVSFLSSAQSQLASTDPFSPSPSSTSAPSFPSYIAYDRACHVLRSLVSSPSFLASFPTFLSSTRLIVTAFHRQGHPASDTFCNKFCNPTPLSGEAPDLVVPFREKKPDGKARSKGGKAKEKGPRTFERAFNTTAAEQLNSTLSRFAPLLSTMRADNFDFVVHVLLRHRAEEVKRKKEKKKGRGL